MMTEQELVIFENIQRSLQIIAGALAKAPNIQQPIGDYPNFDWSKIGARVLRTDADGASVVEHNGRIYKRRSPDNKYEACIWFSRCTGKDESGDNRYETLISFETIKDDVEPLGHKARKALESVIGRTGRQSQPKPTNHQSPVTAPDNVSTFKPKPLTEDELKLRAQRLVTEGRVTFDAASKTYTVQVNDKISYQVKPGPTCDCERFKAATEPKFRCEHIRAVVLFTSEPIKPAQRDELKLLITDLLKAGVPGAEIDAAIAKVCDGLYVVGELSPEQTAKAIRTLQGKLNALAVTRRLEVA